MLYETKLRILTSFRASRRDTGREMREAETKKKASAYGSYEREVAAREEAYARGAWNAYRGAVLLMERG